MMRFGIWFVAGCLSVSAAAAPGLVRTLRGESHRGDVIPGADVVIIERGSEGALQVPMAELAEVNFDPPVESGAPASGSATAAEPGQGRSSSGLGWTGIAIGEENPGTVQEEGGVWQVTGGGSGLQGNGDSFFLAQRLLEASGQVLAKLEALEGGASDSVAGLTLRDNLGEASAYAFVGYRRGSGIGFQYRQIASGMTMRVTNVVLELPAWLRLSRVGGAVVAEMSDDGRQWRLLGRANVNLGQSVRAGMLVAGGTNQAVAVAKFRHPVAGVRGLGYIPESGFPRLLFRGGTRLVAPIRSADESVVRLGGAWTGSLVSVVNLARIEFVPVGDEASSRLEPGRTGLLLADGDFLDGSLRSMATNTVVMSSLMFGFRPYAAGSEAAVIQLGPTEETEAAWTVDLWDGSVIRALEVTARPGAYRVEGPLLGALEVRPEWIRRLRRSAEAP